MSHEQELDLSLGGAGDVAGEIKPKKGDSYTHIIRYGVNNKPIFFLL